MHQEQLTVNETAAQPWEYLPARMRVLFLASRQLTARWLADALRCDDAMQLDIRDAATHAEGVALLRDELFEAVLIAHEPPHHEALPALEAIRGSGEPVPVIVLGRAAEQEMTAAVFEAGGDAYVCIDRSTARSLLWTMHRAGERYRLQEENRHLRQNHQQRLAREHVEAERLLTQQRQIIAELERVPDELPAARPGTSDCPEELITLYKDLLRNYVIMGSGNLPQELAQLARLLATARVSARHLMSLHLQALEELVERLGNRSARHVLARADMLILEMLSHLADGYRDALDDSHNASRAA